MRSTTAISTARREGAHARRDGGVAATRDHDHAEKHAPDEPGEAHAHGDRLKLSPAMIQNAGLEMLTAGPGNVAVTVTLLGEVALNAEAIAHVTPRVPGTAREVKKRLGDTVTRGERCSPCSIAASSPSSSASSWRPRSASPRRGELHAPRGALEGAHLGREGVPRGQARPSPRRGSSTAAPPRSSTPPQARARARAAVTRWSPPSTARIIEKHIAIGEVLKEDTQVFVIADLSTIWVNVTVYAKDLSRARIGQTAWVKAEGIEQSARGTLAYLGQVVDEQSRSAVARVVLQSPGAAWRPGLFATADISPSRRRPRPWSSPRRPSSGSRARTSSSLRKATPSRPAP